ncbi:hypothetical protein TNCV_284571 [Trichonephila clavipes]|uniref:Uncharacterized protein n=1 Tax=Trichonephila clavipes TaxID=2585209 RepID=A0A8X6VLW5_TRICX|nr:hypothetical protein TNCV_284571 [Trichonephila clavipes]
MDEDERNNKNESSKDPSNADAFSALETAMEYTFFDCGASPPVHDTYHGKCIRRGSPIARLPRFPDFNSMNFFFWGNLTSLVHETPLAIVEDFPIRIVAASVEITGGQD